jgi:hypothetical protein
LAPYEKEEIENNFNKIKPVFGSFILGMHSRECIPTRVHFAENNAFGKILKLFIRSDYAERNYVWLVL